MLNVSGITVYAPYNPPAMNFEFVVSIELSDQTGYLITTETIEVYLNFNSTSIGSKSLVTGNGTGNFYATYNNFGFLQLSASTNQTSITSEIIVVEVIQNEMKVVISNMVRFR